jgi:hypothetical protein
MMWTRKKFLEKLHESPKFKLALSMARSDAERQKITRITESFAVSMIDVLAPVVDQSKQDPKFAQQLGQALVERQRVVNSNGPTSGSIG